MGLRNRFELSGAADTFGAVTTPRFDPRARLLARARRHRATSTDDGATSSAVIAQWIMDELYRHRASTIVVCSSIMALLFVVVGLRVGSQDVVAGADIDDGQTVVNDAAYLGTTSTTVTRSTSSTWRPPDSPAGYVPAGATTVRQAQTTAVSSTRRTTATTNKTTTVPATNPDLTTSTVDDQTTVDGTTESTQPGTETTTESADSTTTVPSQVTTTSSAETGSTITTTVSTTADSTVTTTAVDTTAVDTTATTAGASTSTSAESSTSTSTTAAAAAG